MELRCKFDIVEDKLFFDFEDRLYPVDYCCQCETFIISCCKTDDSCIATSCNGTSCPECHEAHEEFWKLAGPLSTILSKSAVARRKQESKDYSEGSRYRSFFDTLGT